ncbi:amino acid adenylation domain-containing protein [Daejeonella rubra]|uniref:Amino acid adenylation domain-containing protein n=1 Tax=Daejeonella rubra TaxID=990371 RepID=A0A1G9XWF3_9SPHI|nr:non-ribosomal peptide synthetase [Daejeonella rubra]SDN01139.1 amino acid adenylation domain-containing protein [Daejeonella rubra]
MEEQEYSFQSIEFDPFAGPEIEKAVPAIEPQSEIWTSCLIGGEDANRSYNESVSLKLQGQLDLESLERALTDLVKRHDALRSGFSADGKQLCVFSDSKPDFHFKDISEKDVNLQQEHIEQFLVQDAKTSFNLITGPLFRVNLFKLAESSHHLTLSAHHIICDGWSISIIMQDLGKLYSAYTKGQMASLEPAPSFADYALSQRVFQGSEEYRTIESFWLNQFKDEPTELDVPVDYPRPEIKTYKSRRDDFELKPELIEAVKKMGAKAGCSFVSSMLVAFEVLLHRITGQNDIILGIPSAGQSSEGNNGLVGHCVNMLPLRSRHHGENTFIDYLKLRKPAIFDAYENQAYTFGSLLKKLNISRDASRVPLIPIVFNIDIGLNEGVKFEGISHELIINKREFENFEIFLNASGSGDSLILEWSYNTQIFKPESIKGMMEDFISLLETVTKEPEIKIKDIQFTESPSSFEWNNTAADYPKDKAVHVLISETANKYPDHTALSFQHEKLSYRALNEKANQLAHFLIGEGIKPGDIVGLALDRSADLLISLLAIMKSGAAYVPLDPAYPKKQIGYMLNDSSAKLLLTSKNYQNKFAGDVREIIMEDIREEISGFSTADPSVEVNGSDLVYLIYTSGSSGKPKGTQIEHHNLVNFLYSMKKVPGISQDDRLLAVTTISFDIAGLEIYLPLLSGAELVLADTETTKDGRLLLDLIRSEKISIMQATPSTWRMVLDAGWDMPLNIKVLCGGEAFPKDLAHSLLAKCSTLWNMYGPTETTIWSTIKQITNYDSPISIGRPIDNTQVYILDQYQKPVRVNGTGEIFIAGDGLARAYLNKSELSDLAFVKNVFSDDPDKKMYRTGDLGKYLPDGDILCLGRADNQVKIRGHRIEPGAIEDSLNGLQGVKEVVVIAREDQPGDKRLTAYIVPENSTEESKSPSWQERWEDLYKRGIQSESDLDITEQQLDIAVAQEISGRTDIKEEVEEWLAQSVNRIKALNAKNVMEVGCGAGQLVFELAHFSENFIATDYAETAIEKLKEKLKAEPEKWKNVRAITAPAEDFSAVKAASLDLVIINGVVQYFPDAGYLIKVIEEASKAIKAGGCIYIGDMQGKSTLPMYHAFDQLARTDDHLSIAEFKKICARRVRLEDELVADPGFFYMLRELIPGISGVDVQLREGKHINETTKYHYDIWLHVNSTIETTKSDIELVWQPGFTEDWLKNELAKYPSKIIRLRKVYNLRTADDHLLQCKLENITDDAQVKDLKLKSAETDQGLNPHIFWAIGKEFGYNSHVRWTSNGSDGLFDVIFIPADQKNKIPQAGEIIHPEMQSAYEYARETYSGELQLSAEQVQEWKEALKELLPATMIPSDFVLLKKLPLLPNGKINRKDLPKPEEKAEHKQEKDLPQTHTEKLVAKIWAETLGLESVGLKDDFFELGGHSLIAVQVMIRLEKETGLRLPLTSLFKFTTLGEFAPLFSEASK